MRTYCVWINVSAAYARSSPEARLGGTWPTEGILINGLFSGHPYLCRGLGGPSTSRGVCKDICAEGGRGRLCRTTPRLSPDYSRERNYSAVCGRSESVWCSREESDLQIQVLCATTHVNGSLSLCLTLFISCSLSLAAPAEKLQNRVDLLCSEKYINIQSCYRMQKLYTVGTVRPIVHSMQHFCMHGISGSLHFSMWIVQWWLNSMSREEILVQYLLNLNQ